MPNCDNPRFRPAAATRAALAALALLALAPLAPAWAQPATTAPADAATTPAATPDPAVTLDPASAHLPAIAQSPRPVMEAFSRAGVDLARATWFASADLPPSASPDEIRSAATRTTPTVQLRTAPGGSGMMFALLEVESPPLHGAVVTIGDIDGADECWFNGHKVGGTSGRGITDFGVPRMYHVDKEHIRRGTNVLALRLSGEQGAQAFGMRREPITFGFVASPPQRTAAAPAQGGAPGVPAIDPEAARAAIAAADPGVTETAPLVRRRPGFGRFGKLMNDGLAALNEISPTRVVQRGGPQFDVGLDFVEALEIASGPDEPGIDPFHKRVRVSGPCSRRPVTYTMLQHVMYPGAVITLEKGPVLQLRVKFSGRNGSMQALSDDEAAAVAPGLVAEGVSAFAFFEAARESAPAVLAVSGGAANVTLTDQHIDVTVSRGTNTAKPCKIHIFYPAGLRRMDLTQKPVSFFDLAADVEPGADPAATVRRWLRLGLHEPLAVDEYARVHASEGFVRVYQVARHSSPAGVDVGGPYLAPPPQVAFARSAYKYPVRLPEGTTSTGVITFSGPMVAVESETTAPGGLSVISYDLPIPPMEERGLIAVPGNEDLRELLNSTVGEWAATPKANGVDVFYKGRTQGFQAFSYLTTDTRNRLLENTASMIPAGLRESAWHQTTEPLSGLPYWWTYYIEGPYFSRFDQDWGNGLSLYGLHTAVKYTGQWELVLREWDAIERMYSWFEVTDDWEWMRASNGEHGHGTGAGDCASASHVAAISYARLARSAGRTEDALYGTWQAARTAVFLLNRFAYNPYAQEHGFKQGQSLVLGFHEGRGFLVGELDAYPWNATSVISGNGVQPENFDLYVKHAPEMLREYEQTFEQAYPNWADGTFKYGRPTIYRDHSGYITLPHIYLRARLRAEGFPALQALVNSARANTHLWWLAPPVLAEVMGLRFDGYVADWGRCGFLGAEVERAEGEGRRRRVELRFDNRFAPDNVEVVLPRRPGLVQINDGPVPLTDSKYANGRLQLRLRRPGLNKVVVVF